MRESSEFCFHLMTGPAARMEVSAREWLEFEGGVISALVQPTGPALSRQWRSRHETEAFKRRIKTQTVPPSVETAALLFWALLASGQITMRKVDGWRSLAGKPSGQIIDLAARSDKLMPLESAGIIPTQIATAPMCDFHMRRKRLKHLPV